ncbi:isopropylmalate/isohomocitrate dehydrogenase [Methanohalobium evestigatum Z-7303]|uniref:3-isopropylmalate dehydrogenase n=1 Tax=Methanohalobium evestigatum (strain ATCC BAA-1072 / DSM 3721 / NBRC 107634 / OCM 161 / Z-7303) TaxID=644295 RepID=D7E7V1_METEZ|nr:isocitrate/isopropylmalate family dehydrogenase [Methanohalobium evestigatum]ADI74174.1 isopropylmalate/isohomocitrate dehydrogenase [Methanohalobium evestigatum Z-7303]
MKLAVVEGDGIGKEVIPEAVKVLDALSLPIEKVPVEIGYGKWKKTGYAITDEDIETLKNCDCILFGAVTTPPDPEYKSVLLTIRKELDMYANIRPVKPLAGITGVTGKSDFNYVIVRENTEGLYSGIEEIHDDVAYTTRVVSRKGSKRIAEYACKLAKMRNNNVTIVHKSNVMKSDKLFLDVCQQTAESGDVNYSDTLVDAMAYYLITYPEKYDVVVTTNLFGDILSDMSAAHIGSMGLMPSANIGEEHAFFEPVHGSAPDIAGEKIANPVAAILSIKMLLQWYGYNNEASLVERSVNYTLNKGIKTPDLGGEYTTEELGQAVIDSINSQVETVPE